MSCHVAMCRREVAGECERCHVNHVCVVHEFVEHVTEGYVKKTVRLCLACRHGCAVK